MTDYEYDAGSTRLLVADDKTMDGVTPLVLIQMEHLADPSLYVHVKAEDAPALALAILEAAGHGGSEAAGFVRGQVEALAKKAEREAEDAKVSVYRLTSLVDEPVATWEQLGEDHKERWRRSYRNTRRFFEGS